jgi:Na+/H+ antiporter NhaD/arsenite permease-like protein
MAFTFIMQNIAANLGGMLTPFGNPQNLYLYSKFNIPTGEFTLTMLPPFLISVALLTLCCLLFIKKETLEITHKSIELPRNRVIVYGLLFVLSIVIVFRVIPFWIGLLVIPTVLFFLDKKALQDVDYGLLCTFVAFFIFSGNMSRIPFVQEMMSSLLEKNTFLVSILSCQVISNVPSAILLSQFTGNYTQLLLGVNIGGVGTLISSLASLITFREYMSHYPEKIKNYLLQFSAFNFGFLILLTGLQMLFL